MYRSCPIRRSALLFKRQGTLALEWAVAWRQKGANGRPEESEKSLRFLLRMRKGFHVDG